MTYPLGLGDITPSAREKIQKSFSLPEIKTYTNQLLIELRQSVMEEMADLHAL